MPTISHMNLIVVPRPEERRRRPRVPVRLTVEDVEGGQPLITHDFGIGGMLVSTTRARWPGQHIHVRLTLPGAPRALRATCRVLEIVEVPDGIGLSLQFLRLAPKAEIAILRFVAERLKEMSRQTRVRELRVAPI